MKIVFFGTSVFAARLLSFLRKQDIEVVAIVTRPDRAKGRSLNLSPPPVKETALKEYPTIPTYQPEKASTPEFAAELSNYHADLFLVVAYGEIIKKLILDIPRLGCINVHASILPKYRGAAPMQRTLMNGEKEAGITIIDMVLQMDAGDMIAIEKTPVPESMTFGELEEKLFELACIAVSKTLLAFKEGKVSRTPQDPSLVTFAPKINLEDTEIDWNKPASDIHNLVRALSPYPGAWCFVMLGNEKKRLKIKKSLVEEGRSGHPGALLAFGKEGWIVACGDRSLRLLEVQFEGKRAMSAEECLKGINQPLKILIKS